MKKKYILLFTIIILLIVCGILIKITLDKKEEKSVIIEEENKNEKEVIDNLVYQYDQDVYLNVVGGLKVNEPAIDLGIVLSTASSFKNIPINSFDLLSVYSILNISTLYVWKIWSTTGR